MGLSGDGALDLPPEFTRPALAGLAVVLGAVVVLVLISSLKIHKIQKALGKKGSSYVQADYGTTVVRRSLRSAKKPERWEPPVIGQGENRASPLATAEKVVGKVVKTPKEAVEAVVRAVASDETRTRKGRPRKSEGGERPKSPRASRPTLSPSPPRTRRTKTPRS